MHFQLLAGQAVAARQQSAIAQTALCIRSSVRSTLCALVRGSK
jgi:hypothetical protein